MEQIVRREMSIKDRGDCENFKNPTNQNNTTDTEWMDLDIEFTAIPIDNTNCQ